MAATMKWYVGVGAPRSVCCVSLCSTVKVFTIHYSTPTLPDHQACYQPAIVALDRNSQALFSWSSQARASNVGGANSRPSAAETWKAVSASLSGDFSLVHYISPNTYAPPSRPIPLFYLYLIANGNFIRPQAFGLDQFGGGDDTRQRLTTAAYKLGAAGAGYAAAMAAVPRARWPMALALASWALLMRGFHGETFRTMFKADVDDPDEVKELKALAAAGVAVQAPGRARL